MTISLCVSVIIVILNSVMHHLTLPFLYSYTQFTSNIIYKVLVWNYAGSGKKP